MSDWCDCGHPTISAHKRRDCPHTPFSKDSGGCNLGDPAIVPAPAGQSPDVSAASVEREWIIYRHSTHTQVYVGIKSDSRDGAISAFLEGAGELSPDRERWSAWDIDAVDVNLPSVIEETT